MALNLAAFEKTKKATPPALSKLNFAAFEKPTAKEPLQAPAETAKAPIDFSALQMNQTFGKKSIADYPRRQPVDYGAIHVDQTFGDKSISDYPSPFSNVDFSKITGIGPTGTAIGNLAEKKTSLFTPPEGEPIKDAAVNVGQTIARQYAATGARLALTYKLTDGDTIDPNTYFGNSPVAAKVGRSVFGKDKPFTATSEDVEFLKGFGVDEAVAKEKSGGALTLLLTALDLTGAGEGADGLKNGVEAIRATKSTEDAFKVAQHLGLPGDIAQAVKESFANADTTKKATEALKDAVKLFEQKRQAEFESAAAKAEKPAVNIDAAQKPDAAKIADRYYKEVIQPALDEKKTVVVAGDDMKKYAGGDYAPENSDEYAKASYDTIKKLVQDPKVKSLVVTGGGPGSGKTEFLVKNIVEKNLADVVYDTSFTNKKGIEDLIDLARANGKDIQVHGILPDLETARYHTVQRAEETGRAVPDEVFANRHAAFPDTLRELLQEGKLQPHEVRLYDLRGVQSADEARAVIRNGKVQENALATLENVRYNENDVRQTYRAERFSSKDGRSHVDSGGGGGSGAIPGKERSVRAEGISGSRSINDLKSLIKERFPNLTESSRQDFAEMISGIKNEKTTESILRQMEALNEKMKATNPEALAVEKNAIDESKGMLDFHKESLSDMPGRDLQRYASNKTEELPEVTGKKNMRSVSGNGKKVATSQFGRRGDDIAKSMGFESVDEANSAYQKYKNARENFKAQQQAVRSKVQAYRDRKAVFDEVVKYVKQEGIERRDKIAAVQDFFQLDDSDMKSLLKNERDIRLMSDSEFDSFMKRIEGRATELHFKREAMIELEGTIFEKELKKVENLQKALHLPDIAKMSLAQIHKFNEALQPFKQGDEFLGVRQLETVRHTDIAGIKTRREALEKLAAQVNRERDARGLPHVTVEDLNKIHVSELDRYRYDTALARQNPLYEIMVQEKNRAFLNSDAQLIEDQARTDEMFRAARESRSRGMLDRLIPSDHLIFNWLEANDADKISLANDMTDKELEAGMYIQGQYREMRDYLLQQQVLKKYITDYVTHIRRGFLEAWKEQATYVAGDISGEKAGPVKRAATGLLAAFKEVLQKYVQDEAYFNILDQRTNQILPLEKFFQYSMKRTGELVPSKNVAKAFLQYRQTFLKKQALDSIIPKLDIYVHSLTPQKMTPRGLEFDSSLKSFFKEWMNSKKGRVTDRALVKPGGKVDFALRTGIALTRVMDLGLSLPVGIASNMGAQAAVFRGLGTKKFLTGEARLFTTQGRKILEKYRNFTGEPVKRKIFSSEGTLGDSLMSGMFGLFSFADRKSRQVYLLGKMTPEEFAKGELSTEQLARMQTDLGRHLPIPGSESIIGKSALGKVATQYKTWAVPLLSSTLDDIAKATKAIKNGDAEFLRSPEFGELLRTIVLSSVVGTATYGIVTDKTPQKDKSFMEVVAQKAAQDALSLVGALNPSFWTSPTRLQAFLLDLADSVNKIVSLETKADGTLTGPAKLERILVPAAVRQLMSSSASESGVQTPKIKIPKLTVKTPKIRIPSIKI